jgi:hypothetical protein
MKRLAKSALGWLSLLLGSGILVWCAYSLFLPNQHFRLRAIDIPGIGVPLAMIWIGWNWIRRGAIKSHQYSSELTVTVNLSNSDFGTRPERSSILGLKHRLEDRLKENQLGEIDGEEFGNGECTIFIQTNAPTEAERLIRNFFTAEATSLPYSISMSSEPRS